MMVKVIQVMILIVLMIMYLRMAKRVGIFDRPNERSSHSKIIVRGGGIIFPFAVFLWSIWNGISSPVFLLSLILISAVSFLDDIYSVDHRLRLIVHFIAVVFLGYILNLILVEWYWWLVFSVLMIGWINAFNFMDGINGMTAFYAISVIIPVFLLNEKLSFTDKDLIILVGISLIIFSLFNARGNALCFAGDVGSVAMAYILGYFVSSLILFTGNWIYIMFLSVYGVDSVLTIVYRLIKGENITEAHRSHLYQYLVNEAKIGHIKVSSAYALLQLSVSITVIRTGDIISPIILMISVISFMICLYIYVRRLILNELV